MFDNDKFRLIRKSRLSQSRIARIIGKTPRTIQRWETGIQVPSKHNIFLLADALGVPVNSFSDLQADDNAAQEYYSDRLGPVEQNILDSSVMSESERQRLVINTRRKNGLLQRENHEIKSRYDELYSLMNDIGMIVYRKDRELRYVYVNDLFLLYFGISDSRAILGRRDIGENEIRRKWSELSEKEQRAVKTMLPVEKEVISIPSHPDIKGKGLGMASIKPLIDRDNNLSGVVGTIIDITGEETSNRQLHFLESAIGHLNHVIWIINSSRNSVIYVNGAVENLYGVAKNEFYLKPHKELDFIYKPDRKRVLHEIGSSVSELCYRIVRSDGEIRRVRQSIYRTALGHEEIEYGVIEDSTGEFRAHEIRMKLENALNSTPGTGFYIGISGKGSDSSLDYEFVSDGMEKVFMAPVKKYYKGRISFEKDTLHPDFHYLLSEKYWKKKRFPHEFEYKIITPHGKGRWIHEKIFHNSHGDYFGICTDITARKKTEQELMKLKSERHARPGRRD